MPIASVMADEAKPDPGAPPADEAPKIGAKNVAPDPDLIKLARARPKVGALTAAGVLFLAIFFVLKLNPDRRFASNSDTPKAVTVADLAKGEVDDDAFVAVEAVPMMSHAIRAQTAKNSLGLRVAPVRGTSEHVWIVLPGDGWEDPTLGPYTGRVRELAELPFASAIEELLAAKPLPAFARASAVRDGFSSGTVKTVGGSEIAVRDTDKVGFDVVDPNVAIVVGSYNERHPNLAAWTKALTDAGIEIQGSGRDERDRAVFDVSNSNDPIATVGTMGGWRRDTSAPDAVVTIGQKLEAAGLWAARVDPVTHHFETTWGALKDTKPTHFTVDDVSIPDHELDLVGLYVVRSIPDGAYAVITGEHPQDYWYVLPVVILVGLIALLFAWALVRAVKRDFLDANAAGSTVTQ